VAVRAVQGLGAALMSPAALSIVMNTFHEGSERNKALGIWGGLGAAVGTVGLIAGGLITSYLGWAYIFYLNVPIGATVLALAPRIVSDISTDEGRRRFDLAGQSPVRGVSCCSSTRSRRRHNTAGARRGRSWC
jgi:MFS family permease